MTPRKQFLLRIDQSLWTELEAWAADELRSVNGQVEYILRDALRKRRGSAAVAATEAVAAEKGQEDEGPTPG